MESQIVTFNELDFRHEFEIFVVKNKRAPEGDEIDRIFVDQAKKLHPGLDVSYLETGMDPYLFKVTFKHSNR